MLKALVDNYPEVRQAAAYGFGIMGLKGGTQYAQHCANVLKPLQESIALSNGKSTEEDISAKENAISAVAKILKHNSSAINVNEVFFFKLNAKFFFFKFDKAALKNYFKNLAS